jgi:hypothetical protein
MSHEGVNRTLEELFRAAIREAQTSEFPDIATRSLMSVVGNDVGLQLAAHQELAPRAAHMELHLDGDRVHEHSTNAKAFGIFLIQVAETAKEYVKDRLHVSRLRSDILVAPGPGSVRATFFAPDPVDISEQPIADHHREGPIWVDANLQSDALHQIAVVLSNSDPATIESEALDGAIQQLPMAARRHLRKAVNEAVRQGWDVSGEFRQRSVGIEPIEMKASAAKYLLSRLVVEEIERTTYKTIGVLDGHKWSTGLMYFIPSDRTRAFPASYASLEVQNRVAELDNVEKRRVEATFAVFIHRGEGSSDAGSRSYVIQSVEPLEPSKDLELDIDLPSATRDL